MPRSKRKAAAARLAATGNAQDFVRKKTKLGKKAQPENATNTSFKSKQIYVPDQGHQQLVEQEKTGLTLAQLLSRATHYNANTRLAAFNAITKSLDDQRTSAFTQAHAQLATIISSALHALQDESPHVRTASLRTLVAVLQHASSIAPFVTLLSSQILACLSHIRVDIRLHGAKTLSAIFRIPHIAPSDIFQPHVANPLDPLADLLGVVSKCYSRSLVLDAIASVCEDRSAMQPQTTRLSTPRQPFFFYHRSTSSIDNESIITVPKLLNRLSEKRAAELLVQIVYILTECFPISEINKDVAKMHMLTMASKALRYVTCSHSITATSRKPLQRTLEAWAKERNRQYRSLDEQLIHMSIAEAALADSRFEIVERYLCNLLRTTRQPSKSDRQTNTFKWADQLILRFMEQCTTPALCDRLATAWVESWLVAAKAGDVSHVANSIPVFERVLNRFTMQQNFVSDSSNLAWSILDTIPSVICASLTERSTEKEATEENANTAGKGNEDQQIYVDCEIALLHHTCNIFRRLAGSNIDELGKLAGNIVHMMCKADLFTSLHQSAVEELLAVLYNARMVIHDSVLKVMIQTCLSKDAATLELGRGLLSAIESFIVEGYHTTLKDRTLALIAAMQVMEKHLKGKEGPEEELFAQVKRMLPILVS